MVSALEHRPFTWKSAGCFIAGKNDAAVGRRFASIFYAAWRWWIGRTEVELFTHSIYEGACGLPIEWIFHGAIGDGGPPFTAG
ncbi:MAG TPA: hypothetical protein DEA91_02340 [Paenibacillus sp.]|nr:hypothetical protein [Paenibacillus sp.]